MANARFGTARVALPIAGAYLAAVAADWAAPWPYIMTPLYAVPVLVAAFQLSPRGVALVAVVSATTNIASGLLERTPPEVVALYTLGLLITCTLALALARQRQVTAVALERAEHHAREAERSRQELQQYLSMVAHDLRNPLAGIVGTLHLLQHSLTPSGPSPAHQQRLLTIGETAAASMGRLIDDVREAGRQGAGAFPVRRCPGDLVAIARSATALQRAQAPSHTFVFEAPDQIGGLWDEERLHQVLGNLLSNAVKYSPPGSRIDVVLGALGREVQIGVADEGIGIAPGDMPQLFTPYARFARTQGIAGSGLGLAITKQIVDAHGGHIAVTPRAAGGTLVTVTLPWESAGGGGTSA